MYPQRCFGVFFNRSSQKQTHIQNKKSVLTKREQKTWGLLKNNTIYKHWRLATMLQQPFHSFFLSHYKMITIISIITAEIALTSSLICWRASPPAWRDHHFHMTETSMCSPVKLKHNPFKWLNIHRRNTAVNSTWSGKVGYRREKLNI